MKKQKLNSFDGLVYSTNPNFVPSHEEEEEVLTPDPSKQLLRIHLDKKQRAGKEVTLITGFVGNDEDLNDLGKTLRSKCGSGGSVKDGEIIVQGDHRKKIADYLQTQGYKIKLIG